MQETRLISNRKRNFSRELSLWNPLYLQSHFLINDIKKYLESIPNNSVVVDIGCGTKPYQKFVQSGVKYIGIDLDTANNNVDIVSSAYEIDIESGSADYVVSFQVLEHLEEPYLMLKEAYRLLKPGGELCITFPMSWHLHEEPYDFFRFTEYGMTYLLTKAGFIQIVVIRQGTTYANLGIRIALGIAGTKFLKAFTPLINLICLKLEKRTGVDVMNYMVHARKGFP